MSSPGCLCCPVLGRAWRSTGAVTGAEDPFELKWDQRSVYGQLEAIEGASGSRGQAEIWMAGVALGMPGLSPTPCTFAY